jgi:hypothetical protein
MRKEFECPRRDGTKAKFVFEKPEGSVWYWDIPQHIISSFPDHIASLPLPDVNLDKANTLKECLDLIAKKRGQDWVGQVVVDLLKPIGED